MWKVKSVKTAFRNKWWHINEENVVLPNGKEAKYYIRQGIDATIVVPVTSDERIVLIEQYRHGKKRFYTEFPAGLNEENEPPEKTAERELEEETGYVGKITSLGSLPRDQGYSDANLHFFLAKDVSKQKNTKLEDTEQITVKTMPLREYKQKLLAMQINHGTIDSLAGFLALSKLGELK